MNNAAFNDETSMDNTNEGNEATLFELIDGKEWDAALKRLKSHEEEAKVADDHGRFPLHEACNFRAPRELVRALLGIFPDSAEGRDEDGILPVHLLFAGFTDREGVAVLEDVDEEVVDLLIEANPAATRAQDSHGRTPLHMAAGNSNLTQPPFLKILAANPEAASVADEGGCLPLHFACHYWTQSDDTNLCEMLEKLLRAFPEAAFTAKNDGKMPIHVMTNCEFIHLRQDGAEAFKLVFEANEDAARVPFPNGDLLLHRICWKLQAAELFSECNFQIFSSVIETYPRAASTPNNDNELPLHLATKHWPLACDRFLPMLVAANPGAMHIPDNDGLTPIDNAVNRESDANEFVAKLFSLSSSNALLSQMEELNVALAVAMKHVNSLEERNRSSEEINRSLEERNPASEENNQSLRSFWGNFMEMVGSLALGEY